MATPSCVLCRIAARELPAPNLHEVDDISLSEILVLIKKIAAAMGIETYNVLQNNGAAAGQTGNGW